MNGYGSGLPNAVKWLLIANAAVFAVQIALPQVLPLGLLALSPYLVTHYGTVWQFFTYMFLHGGIGHIGFNMLGLWMFGMELEWNWGTRDFLKYYIVCGIGGGVLVWLTSFVGLTDPLSRTIGASGAIFGLLVAYGLMWPDRIVLVMGILPMRALHMVIVFGALNLFEGLTGRGGNVAVFAHVGGAVTGFFYLKFGWRLQAYAEHWMKRFARRRFTVHEGGEKRPDSGGSPHPDHDEEVDRILDKIAREGMGSLDPRERRILDRESEKKRRGE